MPDKNRKIVLWYFADPMCSWCWGFSPVMQQIQNKYADQIDIALNLGGLRPGTTHAIKAEERDEILHHWHSVHKMTGQPFKFDNALAEGFVYDTEPASRAVTVVASVDPKLVLKCFEDIQAAFYRDGKDVSNKSVLKELVVALGVTEAQFDELFESRHIKQATQQHFDSSHQAGIRGFPALIWQESKNFDVLCRGYLPFEQLSKDIESRLKRNQ